MEIVREKIKSKTEDGSQLQGAGSIMQLVKAPGGVEKIVRFSREHDLDPADDINHIEFLEIDRELWEDFGKPETITVTIHPSDQYN